MTLNPVTGALKPWAREIVDALKSYTELSPSCTGVKIIVKATLKGGKHLYKAGGREIELYDRKRYFTLTGHRLPGTPATIEERQPEIDALCGELFPGEYISSTASESAEPTPRSASRPKGTGQASPPSGGSGATGAWTYFNKRNPCPLCGRTKSCGYSHTTSLFFCRTHRSDVEGFRFIKEVGGGVWGLFAARGDSDGLPEIAVAPEEGGEPEPDFELLAEELHRDAEGGGHLHRLGRDLGVSVEALRKLRTGWTVRTRRVTHKRMRSDGTVRSWTRSLHTPIAIFPERDVTGRVCGVVRRFPDGAKLCWSGGERGSTYTDDWRERALWKGHLLVVEGGTDTAAAHTMDLAALGRFSNTGGGDLIAGLIADLAEPLDASEVLALAAGVAAAAGSPWGNAFPRAGAAAASAGRLEGTQAVATVGGTRHALGPADDWNAVSESAPLRQRGYHLLLLKREPAGRALGIVALRPRLAAGAADLVRRCAEHAVRLVLVPAGDPVASRAVARRAGVPLAGAANPRAVIRTWQQRGAVVAFASDNPAAAPAFEECDLAVGLSSGQSSRFPARVDLLAPDLLGVAAVVAAGARRDAAVRDSVLFSAASNVAGAVWGLRARPGVARASLAVYLASLAAVGDGLLRLAGGRRPGASLAYLADPHPERWGRQEISAVLKALHSRPGGLSGAEAARRVRGGPRQGRRSEVLASLLDQLRYPTTGILAGAAGLSLFLGHPLDAAVIGTTIAVNVAVGTWQEYQADQAAEALKRLGTATARVLRDGQAVTLPASQVVPGDVLLLAPGDRVAADARLLEAAGLEVDEAALTGESLPVAKAADGGPPEGQVVLEGSDVVVGTGRAVVVAVGRQTRLGATAAALSVEEAQQSPLGARLGRLLWQSLPLTVAGGALVVGAGLLRGRPLLPQLAVGASLALASVPEGLPLLAGMGQAGVARRLARRNALVRRLSAVEALGRVDVACADKTGTMTEGRLSLTLVSDGAREARFPGGLDDDLRRVLLAAGLASPHPEAADARAHPTDVAVVQAARDAGLADELHRARQEEAPFDPTRSFHAAVVGGRTYLKGAAEVLVPRCARLRRGGREAGLDDAGRQGLLLHAWRLASRGLRVLMVAEGPAADVEDPRDLTALGFVAISDPLRPTVKTAVRRCREAGVRVVMITGDHPATARAIAREAGLLDGAGDLVTGAELAELQNGELDKRLRNVTVVARATPLDKLRIIEGLQRLGHAVAMTGDGVNDAPALRLADVGVAMGRGGTEVARQAADVVLADDDFSTLVEALAEGRGFWQNIRRALGLLLGGNLGEMGLIVGTAVAGLGAPLNSRQILVINLITDALPALAVVMRRPGHRRLSGLAREGVGALDTALRRDVLRRGAATALPALGAYLLARGGGAAQAGTVAYGSIIGNQLAQTLDAGLGDGTLDGSVLGAVAGSGGMLAASLLVPPLRRVLGLAVPSLGGWALMGGAAASAVLMDRLLSANGNGGRNGDAAAPSKTSPPGNSP